MDDETREFLTRIELKIDTLTERLDQALNTVEGVLGDVTPTMEKIMEHPLVKMLVKKNDKKQLEVKK